MNITKVGEFLMTDEEEFTSKDGDAWSARNKDYLKGKTVEDDKICRAIIETGIKPKHIMEIGCYNGYMTKFTTSWTALRRTTSWTI